MEYKGTYSGGRIELLLYFLYGTAFENSPIRGLKISNLTYMVKKHEHFVKKSYTDFLLLTHFFYFFINSDRDLPTI